jgi:serine/threonine protein kinase
VWILVFGDVEKQRAAMERMGTLGAVRLDFDTEYKMDPFAFNSGGSALLFAAQPRRQDTAVAAKVLTIDKEDLKIEKLVADEVATLIAAQGHPNVLRFHSLFCNDSPLDQVSIRAGLSEDQLRSLQWIVVTDFHCGGDLRGEITRHGSMSEARAWVLIENVLSALAHIHSRGVVHRDVKAENVLLSSNGQAILADFGIAGRLDDEKEMVRRCGTPGYAAPEVIRGKTYDAKVDVFGAGVLLYFILTSELPFNGDDIHDTAFRTLKTHLSFEHIAFDEVSSFAKDLIVKMVTKRPTCRPTAARAREILAVKLTWESCLSPTAFCSSGPTVSPCSSNSQFSGSRSFTSSSKISSDGVASDVFSSDVEADILMGGLPPFRARGSPRKGKSIARHARMMKSVLPSGLEEEQEQERQSMPSERFSIPPFQLRRVRSNESSGSERRSFGDSGERPSFRQGNQGTDICLEDPPERTSGERFSIGGLSSVAPHCRRLLRSFTDRKPQQVAQQGSYSTGGRFPSLRRLRAEERQSMRGLPRPGRSQNIVEAEWEDDRSRESSWNSKRPSFTSLDDLPVASEVPKPAESEEREKRPNVSSLKGSLWRSSKVAPLAQEEQPPFRLIRTARSEGGSRSDSKEGSNQRKTKLAIPAQECCLEGWTEQERFSFSSHSSKRTSDSTKVRSRLFRAFRNGARDTTPAKTKVPGSLASYQVTDADALQGNTE